MPLSPVVSSSTRGGPSTAKSSSEPDDYWREFELPRDDFEELMWQKRFAPEGASAVGSSRPQSPAIATGPGTARRESTIADTDEPRSSPVSVSGGGPGRGRGRGRGGAGAGGRLSRLQNEVEAEGRRGSRRTSKAPSAAEQPEDEVMEDVDDEAEADEDESGAGEGEESEEPEAEPEQEDEEEAEIKRGGATKRGRGGRRGRGRRGRRR
ncbi:hypothetical protein CLCR_10524 [Cladophialophora carrionii]|uniref:Uncharacterized protein n=1 Tax=Cladophialophora carrionii TaxID=86049 RepID=A0A1C1CY02_9EURO|nr:hypothetical protein CLCR_10524 [Cladophialophora carrionii]